MNRLTRRSSVIAVAASSAVVLGGGVAYAFWTTTGTGTGTAAVGSAVTMTVTSAGVNGLYPKQTTTMPVTVTNTNAFPVIIQNVTLDSVTATGGGCANGDVALNPAASGVSGTTYTIAGSLAPAGSGPSASATLNVPIAAADLLNACQGAGHSFTLTFTAHGISG